MSKITIVFGSLALCAVTVCILVVKQEVNMRQHFIPTFVGVPLILLGFLADRQPSLRMHLMHAAVTIGLLGGLAALGRGVTQLIKVSRGESPDPTAARVFGAYYFVPRLCCSVCAVVYCGRELRVKRNEAQGKA